jgi:hypothetical protein
MNSGERMYRSTDRLIIFGTFRSDGSTRREFLAMIGRTGAGPLSNT